MTTVPAAGTPSAAMARFVVHATMSDLPPAVTEIARREIAEMLRAAARGAGSAPAAAALQALARGAALPEASVIGKGLRLPVTHAALVNATAARDGGASGTAAVIVSAALAVAERDEVAGASFLLAVALGLEVADRVATALGPSHTARGYDVVGTAGRVGAAAACGLVIRLSEDAMLSAFGYAATTAGGIAASPASLRSLVAGMAASDAVWAALLAAAGLVGPSLPLEGRRGLLALESVGGDPTRLDADLGVRWNLVGTFQAAPDATTRAPALEVGRIEHAASVAELLAAAERLVVQGAPTA